MSESFKIRINQQIIFELSHKLEENKKANGNDNNKINETCK